MAMVGSGKRGVHKNTKNGTLKNGVATTEQVDTKGVILTGISLNLQDSFKGHHKPLTALATGALNKELSQTTEAKNSRAANEAAKSTMLPGSFHSPSSEHIVSSDQSSTAETNVKDGLSCMVDIKCLVSCVLLIINVAFFGFALTYSYLYIFLDYTFLDEECDEFSKICNMQLAGCVLISASLVVFSANFFTHLTNFKWPSIQRHYIRILFMVPVLAAQSWVLLFTKPEVFIAYSFIAESYKTFSLYCVLHLFMNFLWDRCRGHELLRNAFPMEHLFKLSTCFAPVKTIREFYIVSIVGSLQCIIIRPATYVGIVLLDFAYSDNNIVFYAAKGISVIQWVSQVYAIYAVLLWVRNFRSHYYILSPLVKHFGLMLFHILIPTLLPQVLDICVRYELVDLEDFFDGRENHNLFYKVQGFIQAAAGFLGTIYITWMYSSRDVKLFSDEDTAKRPVTNALSHMVTLKDILLDFRLMECLCSRPSETPESRYEYEPDSHMNIGYVSSVENVADINDVELEHQSERIFHISVPESESVQKDDDNDDKGGDDQ